MLPTAQLPTWQALDDEAIAHNKALFEQRANDLFNKVKEDNILLTPDELEKYKVHKDVVFTLEDITVQRDRLAQHEAQLAEQVQKLNAFQPSIPPTSIYEKWQDMGISYLENKKQEHEQTAHALLTKAHHEILSNDELRQFYTSKNMVFMFDDILTERKQVTNAPTVTPKPTIDRPAPTTAPTLQTDQREQPRTVIDNNKKVKEEVTPPTAPTTDQRLAQRKAQLDKALATVVDFDKLVTDTANKLKIATVNARTLAFNNATKALSTHEANKPLLRGKDKWEADRKPLATAKRNAEISLDQAKGDTEKLKEWNSKLDLLREKQLQPLDYNALALKQMDKSIKDNAQQARDLIVQINEQIRNEKAQSLGADKLATFGNIYTGKVIKVNENGAYQQTKQGVILHPSYANKPNEFDPNKSYDLNYQTQGQVLKSETRTYGKSSKDSAQEQNQDNNKGR